MKKNLSYLVVLLFSSVIILSSCKKEEGESAVVTPTEDTSVYFKATVGSLKNFKADTTKIDVDTVFSQLGKLTQLTAFDGNWKMIVTFTGRGVGTYPLGITSALNYVTLYDPSGVQYRAITNGGTLNVTKYDIVNHRISGTFAVILKRTTSPNNEVVIYDGKFKEVRINNF